MTTKPPSSELISAHYANFEKWGEQQVRIGVNSKQWQDDQSQLSSAKAWLHQKESGRLESFSFKSSLYAKRAAIAAYIAAIAAIIGAIPTIILYISNIIIWLQKT